MDLKKRVIVLFLIGFCVFVYFDGANAATIVDYKIPVNVPLNDNLTVYGKYSEPDVLCSFFIFGVNDNNFAVVRLNDQYSFSDGSFYAEYKILEPLFVRGYDYNVVTKCGITEESKTFYVDQKNDIAFGISAGTLRNEMAFWTNGDTSLTVVIVFILILIVATIGYFIYHTFF